MYKLYETSWQVWQVLKSGNEVVAKGWKSNEEFGMKTTKWDEDDSTSVE